MKWALGDHKVRATQNFIKDKMKRNLQNVKNEVTGTEKRRFW